MVTIIIPTYNEAENIPELTERLQAVGCKDLLIVDDSPNDKTAIAAKKAKCEVLHRKSERGLSSAVLSGIRHSKASSFVVMDADLQHPPEVIPNLIKQLISHDFVVASRYIKGGGCSQWDLDRKVISRVANLLARPLVPKIHDLVSGLFAFRREGLPDLNTVDTKGFKIMLELLVRGHWASVVEVPYVFQPRLKGDTKMRKEQVIDYASQLTKLYLRRLK